MFRIIYLYIMACVTVLCVQGSLAAELPEEEIAAKVNGTVIARSRVESEVNRLIPQTLFHQGIDEKKREAFLKEALTSLIEKELKIQDAIRMELTIKGKEINEELERIIATYPSRKVFEKQLKASRATYKDAKNEIRRRKLAELAYQLQVVDKVHFTEKEGKAYYDKNNEKFVQPPRYRLKNILFKVPPLANDFERTTIGQNAEAVFRKIKKGLPFEKAVQKYSEDDNKESNGDMKLMHQGQLNPEIEPKVLALKPGEIAGPFKTLKGFHIFRMEEVLPERLSPFEKIKRRLIADLTAQALKEREKIWLDGLKSKAKIIIMKK